MVEPRMLYSYQYNAKHHRSNPIWLPHDLGALVIDGREFVMSYLDGSPPVRKRLPYEAPSLGVRLSGPSKWNVLIEGQHGEIWIAHLDVMDARPLAFGTDPTWSPDGDSIAFFSNVAGRSELLVMRRIGIPYWSVGKSFGGSISWSPDGNQLVLTQEMRITTVNIDGSEVRVLVPHEWYGWGFDPRWSPRGDLIAFHQHADENRLFVINLNGTLVHTFTDFKNLRWLAWSPDGQRLVCQDQVGIHVIDLESERRFFLAEGYSPCWSRTGKQILYSFEGSIYVAEV